MEISPRTSHITVAGSRTMHHDNDVSSASAITAIASAVSSPDAAPDADVSGLKCTILQLEDPLERGPRRAGTDRLKTPILTIVFLLVGLAFSLSHCVFYRSLQGKIVGGPAAQEEKIRFGTAFSFLAQITLTASVWISYTQWLWRTVKKKDIRVGSLSNGFSADTSPLALLDYELLKKLGIGWLMACFAWSLLLPPFFTPATLFVYPSTTVQTAIISVPYPSIANSSEGHRYSYSPPARRGTTQNKDDRTRMFTGLRTILSLIATATASVGEILPIKLPFDNSAHSVEFFAPLVRCINANASTAELIEQYRKQEMTHSGGTIVETDNVYYAFVPTFDETGDLVPVSTPRQQSPLNATNELWLTFLRPVIDDHGKRVKERHFQVCLLHNATYDLHIERDHGLQNIRPSYTVNEVIPYPRENMSTASNMAQHAYSAFMVALCDQVVGKFSWFNNTAYNDSSPLSSPSGAPQYGVLESAIMRTSLLGSLDLDAFFDLADERSLYKNPKVNGTLSDQRLMDKNMARNRTLDVLIEELSFNISVGLMWDSLLTQSKTVPVNLTEAVNRYDYKPWGLFLPYALADTFTLLAVAVGLYSFVHDGVMPGKKFEDLLAAAEDPEIVFVVRSRKRSLTAVDMGGKVVLRAGTTPAGNRRDDLRFVKKFSGKVERHRERRDRQRKKSKSRAATASEVSPSRHPPADFV